MLAVVPLPLPARRVTAEGAVHDLILADGALLGPSEPLAALVTSTLAREDALGLGSEVSVRGPEAPAVFRVVGILAGDGPWGGADGRGRSVRGAGDAGDAGDAVGVRGGGPRVVGRGHAAMLRDDHADPVCGGHHTVER